MNNVFRFRIVLLVGMWVSIPLCCESQSGQIALTQVISTVAGNGSQGAPTSGPALTSKLDQPLCVAVDSSKNLFISETDSYINLVSAVSGSISTLAGNGTSGYSGDGGLATSAEVNVARGLAVDSSGDVYISDSGNNRIRLIYEGGSAASAILAAEGISSPVSGYIYTIAGNGSISGGSSSGALGTSQTLNSPRGLYVDASGDLYITDQIHIRILYAGGANAQTLIGEESSVTSPVVGHMYTVAGSGSNTYNGENTLAIGAGMNPTSVAVDSGGNVYFADQATARVQVITLAGANAGEVSTIAGNGTAGDSGDGGTATSAKVNTVRGMALDGAGNLYLADSANNSIRRINASGIIITIAGTNTTSGGYGGDGGKATTANLNLPYDVAFAPDGTMYIPDLLNNRVRVVNAPPSLLSYPDTQVGSVSASQSVTMTNIGTSSLTLSAISIPAGFEQTVAGGSNCGASTVIAPGEDCVLQFAFDPTAGGINTGASTVISDGGSLSLSLSGTGLAAQTNTTLNTSSSSGAFGQSVLLTANITTTGPSSPSGNVTFFDSGTPVGTGTLAGGTATFSAILTRGMNSFTASYQGDANNVASVSSPVAVLIAESLSALAGNNTAACPASGTLPSYCSFAFTGQSDTRNGVETVVFDPSPGNVSTEDIHGYLNAGSATKIYANFMEGFCITVQGTSPNGASDCNNNVMPGYTSNSVATVQAQADDLFRRHIDGAMMTWEGSGGTTDQVTQKLRTYLESAYCSGPQGCAVSYGIQLDEASLKYTVVNTGVPNTSSQGCPTTDTAADYDACVIQHIENDICYMNGVHWNHTSYIKNAAGRPILQIFTYEAAPLDATGPSPSWQHVWDTVSAWNADLPTNCVLSNGDTTYAGQNGIPLLVFGGVAGYTHPDSNGAYYWVDSGPIPTTTAELETDENIFNISTDFTYNNIVNTEQWFYEKATSTYSDNATYQNWGGAFKGTNSFLSTWGVNRLMDQQCGLTWIRSLTESNSYYSTTALPYLEIDTCNDYNSGTSIEPGIDNCYTVSAAVAGNTLSWTLVPSSSVADPSTVSHMEIYDSPDSGLTFTLVGTQSAATSGTFNLTGLPSGAHQLYVYMMGKNSILNRMSQGILYNN